MPNFVKTDLVENNGNEQLVWDFLGSDSLPEAFIVPSTHVWYRVSLETVWLSYCIHEHLTLY